MNYSNRGTTHCSVLFCFIFCIIAFINFGQANAQNRNSTWCFGDSAGINFSNINNPITFSTALDSRGSCVSISDTSGSLHFYANTRATVPGNTTLVWNKLHQLMLNGDSVVGGGWYRELVITPAPDSDSLFYLFSAGVTSSFGFYYSIIDMSQDGGNGAVVVKNVQLQSTNFFAADGITAIKHGNGRDWWVVVRQLDPANNEYFWYLVSPSGVTLDHTQNIGDIVYANAIRIEPSNDGSKIAVLCNKGFTAVYDFNRCDGLLTNEHILEQDYIVSSGDSFPWYWSCTFSPNNQLLYVNAIPFSFTTKPNGYLYQYNLNDPDPVATRILLDSTDVPESGRWVKLAPDGKIYVATIYEQPTFFPYPYPDSVYNSINMNLGVINSPDSLGAGCDFQPYSFYLGGKRTYGCLPNNPNYELGALVGSSCDTLVSLTEPNSLPATLSTYYHSGWEKAFINAQNLKGHVYKLQIYDLFGQLIYKTEGNFQPPYFTKEISLTGSASGTYIVRLETEKETLTEKLLIVK